MTGGLAGAANEAQQLQGDKRSFLDAGGSMRTLDGVVYDFDFLSIIASGSYNRPRDTSFEDGKAKNMMIFHLSDLHLGKRLNEHSLIDDQRHILEEILGMVDAEAPDAIMISGDVYDKAMPPSEAVVLFDDFLWELSRQGVPTLVISGNHDSAERLSFGSRLMEGSRVHISRAYSESASPIVLEDEYGPVCFYLLPFVKPVHVRQALERDFPDEAKNVRDYTDAIRAAIAHMGVDDSIRNVLLAHQFVTGAKQSDSENINVGGLDGVSIEVFEPFDYVALGHLHAPQRVGRETVRYCGTPLKYSFSEVTQRKSVTVVELGAKGVVSLRQLPLKPLHDLREIRGTYDTLMAKESYEGTNVEDYLHVTLTDEEDVPYAIDRLRSVYPNILQLSYDNKRTNASPEVDIETEAESLTPMELFSLFFEKRNGQPMDERQRAYLQDAIEKIWEDAE